MRLSGRGEDLIVKFERKKELLLGYEEYEIEEK